MRWWLKYFACELIMCAVYGHDYMALFPAGIAAYYVWTVCRGLAQRFAVVTVLASLAIGGLFLAVQVQIAPHFAWDPIALPALIVVAALLCESAGWKAGRWALIIGNLSYALYLTHILALRALHDIVDFKHSAAAMLATLAICLVVAACAHYLFEVPVTSLLKRRPTWKIRLPIALATHPR